MSSSIFTRARARSPRPGGAAPVLAHGLSGRDAFDLMFADGLSARWTGRAAAPRSLFSRSLRRRRLRSGRRAAVSFYFLRLRDVAVDGRGRGVIGRIASCAGGSPHSRSLGAALASLCSSVYAAIPGTAELSVSPSASSVPFSISRARYCQSWRARSRALGVGERLAGMWMSAIHAGRWVVCRTVGWELASGRGERQDGNGVSVPWLAGGVCSGSGGAGVVSPLARVRIARMVPCATWAAAAMSRWASPSRAARAIAW